MTAFSAPRIEQLALVRDHQARIWRYLRCLGCSAADAEDLAQETFLAVLRKPFEQRGAGQTASYLQTVARNLFLKSRRAGTSRPTQVDLDEAEATWNRFCADDGGERYVAALRECITELDGRAREAVKLRYDEGKSRGEMAERLGLSGDGIKSLLRRVRNVLRACVERRIS